MFQYNNNGEFGPAGLPGHPRRDVTYAALQQACNASDKHCEAHNETSGWPVSSKSVRYSFIYGRAGLVLVKKRSMGEATMQVNSVAPVS